MDIYSPSFFSPYRHSYIILRLAYYTHSHSFNYSGGIHSDDSSISLSSPALSCAYQDYISVYVPHISTQMPHKHLIIPLSVLSLFMKRIMTHPMNEVKASSYSRAPCLINHHVLTILPCWCPRHIFYPSVLLPEISFCRSSLLGCLVLVASKLVSQFSFLFLISPPCCYLAVCPLVVHCISLKFASSSLKQILHLYILPHRIIGLLVINTYIIYKLWLYLSYFTAAYTLN